MIMTVATDAVFEMPDDKDNEGLRKSTEDPSNIADPHDVGNADTVDERNVPHSSLDSQALQDD